MEREVFARRFQEASVRARDFARELVEEPLPDEMLFRVRLNASYDGNPLHEDERVFPDDKNAELAHRLSRCTSEEVVDILFRDGMVPEWVNLSIIGEVGTATLIEVLSCGRFTRNERLLYHAHEGGPPFHVLGPSQPVDYVQGQKFSVYERSEASSRDELEMIAAHASKVWSLDLLGPNFDDEALASLPVFEGLHILELKSSPLRGGGLAALGRQPKLRHFRLSLDHDEAFSASQLPTLQRLETFAVQNLPRGSWDFANLTERLKGLAWLTLNSRHDLLLDGRVRGSLRSCTLTGRRVEGDPLPKEVVSLHLHLSEACDSEIDTLLSRVESVKHLSLRGTPVTDAFVEEVASRWKLEYLDVVDTRVGLECLRRIRARNPELRTHPLVESS